MEFGERKVDSRQGGHRRSGKQKNRRPHYGLGLGELKDGAESMYRKCDLDIYSRKE